MELKEKVFDASFNRFAQNYDEIRPKYPNEMYKEIKEFCNITHETNLLEIGTGSGIATIEIAKMNPKIITVEPGEKLIDIAKNNLATYNNIEYICDTFENCEFEEKKFNVILSATAFHWLDENTKYGSCAKYLRDDGNLVLFWNSFCRENIPIMKQIDKVYEKYLGRKQDGDVNKAVLNKIIKREQEIVNNENFYIAVFKRYKTIYKYNSDTYTALLNTFPEIINLEDKIRCDFLSEIKEIIIKNNNIIEVPILTTIYILRKKEQFTRDMSTLNNVSF